MVCQEEYSLTYAQNNTSLLIYLNGLKPINIFITLFPKSILDFSCLIRSKRIISINEKIFYNNSDYVYLHI